MTVDCGREETAIWTFFVISSNINKVTNERLKTEHAALQRKYYELSSKYEQCVLQIEHVLASDTNF
jgi:hypothetical protein